MSSERALAHPFHRPAPTHGVRVLPQLDALRGVAILAVFVQHLGDRFMPFVEARVNAALPRALAPWLLTTLHHAWWGVDLFFVLSGFSLAQGYVRAFDRGLAPPRAVEFLRRRAARIFPGFLVALAIVVASHPRVVTLHGFPAAIAAHLALLQGYVTPGGLVFIGAAWSLTTEAHFYVLLPFLARPLLARDMRAPWRPWAFAAALCVFAWVSRALLHAIVLDPGVHSALLEATQRRWISSRLDQFVLGAVAALAFAELTRSSFAMRARALAPYALVTSAALTVVAFRLEGARYLSPGGSWPYALLSLATTGIVLSAVLCEGRTLRLIAPAPLCAVGVVSYGFFLYHQLAIGITGALLGHDAASWTSLAANAGVALGLSVAMGLASWIAVERPALSWSAARSKASAALRPAPPPPPSP